MLVVCEEPTGSGAIHFARMCKRVRANVFDYFFSENFAQVFANTVQVFVPPPCAMFRNENHTSNMRLCNMFMLEMRCIMYECLTSIICFVVKL